MTHKKTKIALAAVLCCATAGAMAQIRPAYTYPGAQPAQGGIRMGESPAFFTPWLGLGAGYDDNLLLSSSNERSTYFYVVSPGFKIDARSPGSVLQLTHQHQIGRYTGSHADDYVDHVTHLQGDWAFSGRTFASSSTSAPATIEPRSGSTIVSSRRTKAAIPPLPRT